jgi:N-acetylmuramoyl-L-alanine amidase
LKTEENLKKLFAKSQLCKILIICAMFCVSAHALAANVITAARVWPAQDYTRVTFEANSPLKYQLIVLKNPDRLVLDIEDVDLNLALKALTDKILSSDPYIKQVRAAKYKANVVRVVVDLKGEVKSNLFALLPAGDYKFRLVLDIYPLQDPLMAMLENRDNPSAQQKTEPEELPPTSGEAEILEPMPPEYKAPDIKNDSTSQTTEKLPPLTTDKTLSNKDGERMITIAIDPGHGGEDPGAHGANGTREKDLTLAIGKKLKALIDAEPNMRGILTRDADFFIPLHGRVVKARNMKADLFVSIHADAFTNQAARGSSVFALSERGATSASARYLAKKENESDLIGGVSLDNKDPVLARTLLDLSQAATINDSLKLGKAVLGQVGQVNSLHKGSVEQAAFAVLKSPDIPSILVETAFISNPEEERKLNSEDHQEKLAASILEGIKKYFATNPALAKTKVADK